MADAPVCPLWAVPPPSPLTRPPLRGTSPRMRHDRRDPDDRRPLVERLFSEWLGRNELPSPLDSFLSRNVRPQLVAEPWQRKKLTDLLFATQQFGYLALFCDDLLDDRARRESFDAGNPVSLEKTLARFAALYPDATRIYDAWRLMTTTRFFHWVGLLSGLMPGPEGMKERAAKVQAGLAAHGGRRAKMLLAGVPLFYEAALGAREALGFDVTAFLSRQNQRPPLWIRTPAAERETVKAILEKSHVKVRKSEVCDTALELETVKSLYESSLFHEGAFEVQDLASQLAGATISVRPGAFVWDACAGSGGKTLQLATALNGRGVVYASDNLPYKLDALRKRARRAEHANIRTLDWHGDSAPEFPHEVKQHGGFDAVLVDAPCTSSGTWRRNPDARFRHTPKGLASTIETQTRLLAAAAASVRVGGQLVYVTCSFLVDENEAIAEAFAAAHPEFESLGQRMLGCPEVNGDTFFAASFRRR